MDKTKHKQITVQVPAELHAAALEAKRVTGIPLAVIIVRALRSWTKEIRPAEPKVGHRAPKAKGFAEKE